MYIISPLNGFEALQFIIDKFLFIECVRIAEDEDFVIGFICQSAVSTDPTLVHMTPGNSLFLFYLF